jgi:serine/threonine-protein kinase
VLRHQYIYDEEFVHRFRREAQSAASLSHPNVVSVYDVGQDGDTHFIVMEYVEGSNLNEIIKSQAPLQVSAAVHIATQICNALDHAHSNGIIHRDIKPHNILIGNNGRVKVTDFGIARAITSSTITQTGAVVGSVHYFSPEHAKGLATNEKSDIYSLGIVMYQMVTGKLPFVGESPISVALKHMQERVEDPRIVNPMIPQSVENIILKALRKRPEERYATAHELLEDLETSLSPERSDEPKTIYSHDEMDDVDATKIMPAIRFGKSSNNDPFVHEVLDSLNDAEEGEKAMRRKKTRIRLLIWLSVLLVLIGLAWFGIHQLKKSLIIPTVDVPSVERLPLDRAVGLIEEAGLVVEQPILFEFSREVPADYVIAQSKAGETARELTPIRLTVSKGVQTFEMPNLIGKPQVDATALLKELGMPNSSLEIEYDFSEREEGNIVSQFPSANQTVDPFVTIVRLVVSRGLEAIDMPNLIGLTLAEAQALLERNGLVLQEKNIIREKTYFPEGRVFKQFPYEPEELVEPPAEEILVYISGGLPEEAESSSYTVIVSPNEQNKQSAVRVVISDAMGEQLEVINRTIAAKESLTFEVVTSPLKNAVIEVFLDGKKLDQLTWTYQQALENNASSSSTGANADLSSGRTR